jgi:hypothetical protein
MVTEAEHDELLRQQQLDRQQLLLYATRLAELNEEIQAYAVRVQAIEARHRAEMSEVSARLILQVIELRSWKAHVETSRAHRLAATVLSLYRVPVVGSLLLAIRRMVLSLGSKAREAVGVSDDRPEETQLSG